MSRTMHGNSADPGELGLGFGSEGGYHRRKVSKIVTGEVEKLKIHITTCAFALTRILIYQFFSVLRNAN